MSIRANPPAYVDSIEWEAFSEGLSLWRVCGVGQRTRPNLCS